MIGRRNFCALISGAALGVGASGPAVGGVSVRMSGSLSAAEQLSLLRTMTNPSAAQAVARHLPAGDEVGATPRASAERITASIEGATDDDKLLRHHVATRIRQDYSEGRTVLVAGWSLALTEARLAALWRDV